MKHDEYMGATRGLETPEEREEVGRLAHQTYYAQFVDESVKRWVRQVIGEDEILASTDPHFNDIPLRRWDALAGYYPGLMSQGPGRSWKPPQDLVNKKVEIEEVEPREDGKRYVSLSLADCCCIYKEAARQIKEDAQ